MLIPQAADTTSSNNNRMSSVWKIASLNTMTKDLLKDATAAIDSESILLHVPSQEGKGPHPHMRYTLQSGDGIDLQLIEDGEPQETLLGKYRFENDMLRIVFHDSETPKSRPVDVSGKVPQKDVIVLELERIKENPKTDISDSRSPEQDLLPIPPITEN
jgi:hypothetical protein